MFETDDAKWWLGFFTILYNLTCHLSLRYANYKSNTCVVCFGAVLNTIALCFLCGHDHHLGAEAHRMTFPYILSGMGYISYAILSHIWSIRFRNIHLFKAAWGTTEERATRISMCYFIWFYLLLLTTAVDFYQYCPSAPFRGESINHFLDRIDPHTTINHHPYIVQLLNQVAASA